MLNVTDPVARMRWMLKPMPPAVLLIIAQFFKVSYIPSILSSFMHRRKQLLSCGWGVPALNKVGDA